MREVRVVMAAGVTLCSVAAPAGAINRLELILINDLADDGRRADSAAKDFEKQR